jgi:acetolactate synthase I/II/III large subunit
VDHVLHAALDHDGPALVEFLIEQEANVFPMIPPGASLSEPIESEAVTA